MSGQEPAGATGNGAGGGSAGPPPAAPVGGAVTGEERPGLARLWAGWRSEYSAGAQLVDSGDRDACVFCRILGSGLPDEDTYVVHRGQRAAVLLNAYPYTSGHVMAMPIRHAADPDELDDDESAELWSLIRRSTAAVRGAYRPEGLNVGANLGKAAGAGVPGHLHVHVLPRWAGDTNFMTSIAEARVMPEALGATWAKLRAAWPGGTASPPTTTGS